MEKIKVSNFLNKNKEILFPNDDYTQEQIEQALIAAPETADASLSTLRLMPLTVSRLISIIVGIFGVDRFLIGDYAMGLVKLFTFGGFFILWIYDCTQSDTTCRKYNCMQLVKMLHSAPVKTAEQTTESVKKSDPFVTTGASSATNDKGDYIFLSYSHSDKERLMPLFSALRQSGLNVWFDECIRPRSEWEQEIIENLSGAYGFLYFVTKNSLASQNCRDEIHQARQMEKKFINIIVDDIDLTKPEYKWFDFRYARYQHIPAYAMTVEQIVAKIKEGLA